MLMFKNTLKEYENNTFVILLKLETFIFNLEKYKKIVDRTITEHTLGLQSIYNYSFDFQYILNHLLSNTKKLKYCFVDKGEVYIDYYTASCNNHIVLMLHFIKKEGEIIL